jgi:hypothetical protein
MIGTMNDLKENGRRRRRYGKLIAVGDLVVVTGFIFLIIWLKAW